MPYEDDVAKLTTGLMKKDNPLMRQAKTAGKQIANRRGLLNSSMAVGASQAEAYKAAVPLAQQNASQGFQKNVNERQREFQGGESAKDRAQQSKLQDKQYAFQGGESAKERAQRLKMQSNDLVNQTRLQTNDFNFRSDQSGLDREQQTKMADWNLKSNEQKGVADMTTNFQSLYQNTVANINANKDLSKEARTSQLRAAKATLNSQMKLTEQLYDIDMEWDYTIADEPNKSTQIPEPSREPLYDSRGNPVDSRGRRIPGSRRTEDDGGNFNEGSWGGRNDPSGRSVTNATTGSGGVY